MIVCTDLFRLSWYRKT